MNKTIFYLIRHGESQGNAIRAFLGHTNLDLTEKGHLQAQRTAEYLKDIRVDVIYSSDLLRAYNTAKHTADLKGMDIIKNTNLREIFAGDWENRRFDDLETDYPESYRVWRNDVGNARPDNGESVAELQTRIVSELKKIAEANRGKTVFVFTHATPIRTLKAFCDNKTLDEIKDIPWASNASVTKAEFADGSFKIVSYGEDEFIGDVSTSLPANV